MSEVFAQCGDGTVFPTVVRVLNEADMTFGPNATLPIMSLVGFCPRTCDAGRCPGYRSLVFLILIGLHVMQVRM